VVVAGASSRVGRSDRWNISDTTTTMGTTCPSGSRFGRSGAGEGAGTPAAAVLPTAARQQNGVGWATGAAPGAPAALPLARRSRRPVSVVPDWPRGPGDPGCDPVDDVGRGADQHRRRAV